MFSLKNLARKGLIPQTCQLLKIAWCSTFRCDAQRRDICIAAQFFWYYVESVYSKKIFFMFYIKH